MEPRPGDQIPAIPGLDSAELLERVSEDLDLLWEILGDFSDSYRDTPVQLAAVLEQDPSAALKLVHTLKGVLGNLAATDLFNACKALHEAIREGRTERYAEYMASLSQGIPALCDAIVQARTATTNDPPAPPAPDAGLDWLNEHYAALRVALTGHRARDSKALADELVAAGLPATERPFCDELHLLVRSYRFQEALSLLERHLDA
jgi:HPt (histidine-containing phosphotransfer) domain-containing protein